MKITFGSDGNNLESKISKRFGHAKYYLVYDTESENYEVVENVEENHTHGVLYDLIEKGTEVFMVGNIGPHAFEIAKTDSTKIFLSRNKTIQEALQLYFSGELKELIEPTVKKSINHSH